MDNTLPDSEETLDLNALPAELQAFHQRLTDDGAVWQAASAERLTALAQTLVARVEQMTPATHKAASDAEMSAPSPLTPRQAPPSSQRPPRRREWIAGTFAAIAVVVLLAIVLRAGLAGRDQNLTGLTQPTEATAHGLWQTLDKLTVKRQAGMSMIAVVAPSNTQVEYVLSNSQDNAKTGNASLRRTTDGGNTWKTQPLTVLSAGSISPMLKVSPLDDRTLFLVFWDQSTACAQTITNYYPGAGCPHGYFSSNGGDSWQRQTLPVPFVLAPYSIAAQGSLLYAFNYCNVDSCTHVLSSADGGLTWKVVDGDVADHKAYTCEFTLAPGGTTIYDVASNTSCEKAMSAGLETIWRSDNAGANWTQVGPLLPKSVTDPSIGLIGSSLLASPGTTHAKTLYLIQPYVSGAAHDVRFYYSEDSGATWNMTPALSGALTSGGSDILGAGPPPGVLAVGTATVLSDGSFLFFASPDVTVTPYIWTPGTTAWHRLPRFPDPNANEIRQIIVTPGANGHDAVTMVVSSGSDQTVSSTVIRYQF